jgi:hypothetical protein
LLSPPVFWRRHLPTSCGSTGADFETKVREALHDGEVNKIEREMLAAEAKSLHMAPSRSRPVIAKVKRLLVEEAREEAERSGNNTSAQARVS